MKTSMFHLMPYRDLPADFEQKHRSVWVDLPFWEVADPVQAGQYYNWTLDELIYAARAGFDGVCVNEHHQNAYGFMANPNLMGAVLARATNGLDVALVQLGATLVSSSPPTRIAEEYAMLDCISGGRVVAGLPLGSAMDASFCIGIPPMEHRERYREAHDLVLKAWTAREGFPWNGRYYQLPMVNLWPRPIQTPHPPVWVPGFGSLSTWEFCAQHNHCYSFLSYYGGQFGKRVMDSFWEFIEEKNLDRNPYRAGFLQLVVVSETDARAEEEYFPHIKYFFDKGLHVPLEYQAPPGYQDYRSMVNTMSIAAGPMQEFLVERPRYRFQDYVDRGIVIGGSPATVRDRLKELVKSLNVGNLMVLLQIGSMPHELTLKNIDLFAREVLPHIRGIWDDQWENHWWPAKLRARRP
uniref:Luciferase family protein n=1 Tax=Byssovorax cruenta TaxID=293647 RepID=A0A3S5GXZ0_9BACT|nr:luciferase family protein [Byssovorax cruenta]